MGYWIVGAFLWGFLEASVFFLVPDILLTMATIRFGGRRAAALALLTASAAAVGGGALYWYAASDVQAARDLILSVPAVGADQVAAVQNGVGPAGIGLGWIGSLVSGAFTGIPYKIYAVEAAAAGIDPLAFILVSIPARLLRFLVVVGVTALSIRILESRLGITHGRFYRIAGAAWIIFYIGYFSLRLAAP